MKKNPIILALLGLLVLGFTACKQVTPSPTPTIPAAPAKGNADFTKYVAIGASLTAGFTNNGLYNTGMQYAYPNLLAGQLAMAGGGAFTQPTFGTGKENGSGFLKLTALPSATNPSPTIVPETTSLAVIGTGQDNKTPLLEKYTGSLNNLGIPGVALKDVMTAGYGFNNPMGFNQYFERLLGTTDAASNYVDFVGAKASGATFFTCWMGANDALGSALAGGALPVTDNTTYTANLKAVLDKMGSAKGAILSIPKVTLAAQFTTITLTALQAAVQAGGAPANSSIFITTATGVRAATAEDLFLLLRQTDSNPMDADNAYYSNLGKTNIGAGAPFPYGLHPNNPLETQTVLDKDETAASLATVDGYNAIIKAEATARGLAYIDINTLLAEAAGTNGYTANGITYRTAFITGGIFSLDGIHLTPAGNAIVANQIIKAVNSTYGSTVPELNNALFSSLILSK